MSAPSAATPITRRRALGLAASAAVGTVLAGNTPAWAAANDDLFVITANFGRTNNTPAYAASMSRLRNGVKVGGQTVRTLVGFQEIGEGDKDPNLERKLIGQYYNVHFEKFFLDQGPSTREPIVVPPPFTKVSQTATFVHKGIAHLSPTRFINEVVLQDMQNPMLRFAMLNTHYIAGAYNSGRMMKNLQPYWDKHNQVHRDRIAFYHQQGLPVIWTGDVNRPQMGPLHPMEQRVLQGGIDQIRWIPGSDGTQIALRGHSSIPLLIDGHNAQVARFKLTRA